MNFVLNVFLTNCLKPFTAVIYNGNYYTLIDTTILINDDYTGWGKGWDQIRALGGIIEPPFMGNGIYEFFIKRNYNGDLLDFNLLQRILNEFD